MQLRFPKLNLIIVGFFALISCESDFPPIIWEGERLRFGTSYDSMPFGSTLEIFDQSIVQIEKTLLPKSEQGRMITLYWMPSDLIYKQCGNPYACTTDNKMLSVDPVNYHEAIHALANSMGRSHRFLSEGFATAYAGYPLEADYSVNQAERIESQLVPNLKPDEVDYAAANFFTLFFVESYGFDAFLALYRSASPDSGQDEFDSSIQSTIKKSLQTVLQEIEAIPQDQLSCYYPRPLCLSPTMEAPLKWHSIVEKPESGFTGPYESSYVSWYGEQQGQYQSGFVVNIPIKREYTIQLSSSGNIVSRAIIRSCHAKSICSEPDFIADLHYGPPFHDDSGKIDIEIEPGVYKVDVHIYNISPVLENSVTIVFK